MAHGSGRIAVVAGVFVPIMVILELVGLAAPLPWYVHLVWLVTFGFPPGFLVFAWWSAGDRGSGRDDVPDFLTLDSGSVELLFGTRRSRQEIQKSVQLPFSQVREVALKGEGAKWVPGHISLREGVAPPLTGGGVASSTSNTVYYLTDKNARRVRAAWEAWKQRHPEEAG